MPGTWKWLLPLGALAVLSACSSASYQSSPCYLGDKGVEIIVDMNGHVFSCTEAYRAYYDDGQEEGELNIFVLRSDTVDEGKGCVKVGNMHVCPDLAVATERMESVSEEGSGLFTLINLVNEHEKILCIPSHVLPRYFDESYPYPAEDGMLCGRASDSLYFKQTDTKTSEIADSSPLTETVYYNWLGRWIRRDSDIIEAGPYVGNGPVLYVWFMNGEERSFRHRIEGPLFRYFNRPANVGVSLRPGNSGSPIIFYDSSRRPIGVAGVSAIETLTYYIEHEGSIYEFNHDHIVCGKGNGKIKDIGFRISSAEGTEETENAVIINIPSSEDMHQYAQTAVENLIWNGTCSRIGQVIYPTGTTFSLQP